MVCEKNTSCVDCMTKWLNKKHEEPMPELKTGMFVEVRCISVAELGVVIGDKIVYKNGYCDELEVVREKIVRVYDEMTNCFNSCFSENIIWERDG